MKSMKVKPGVRTSLCKKKELFHVKVLLNSFHLNGHTLGFHPLTQTLAPHCTVKQTVPQESTAQ